MLFQLRKTTTLILKRKRKRKKVIPYEKLTHRRKDERLDIRDGIITKIKKHKLRFDIAYEKGIYDMTPQEADIYVDSIDDIIMLIKRM